MQNFNLKPIEYHKKYGLYKISLNLYPTHEIMDAQYFNNITKVRCIAITEKQKICLISDRKKFHWMVPGGTIEKGENAIATLKREILEEANLEITNYELIGFINFKKVRLNDNKKTREHTEMWFIALISNIFKQVKDPSTGYTLYRNFFTPNAFRKIHNWGNISNYFLEKIKNKLKNGNLSYNTK